MPMRSRIVGICASTSAAMTVAVAGNSASSRAKDARGRSHIASWSLI